MNRFKTLLLLAVVAVFILACGKDPVMVGEVSLNKTSLTLEIGASEPLTVTVVPDNADDKSITWASSNRSIADVDGSGKVTAMAIGSATITAEAVNGKKTTCEVTVKAVEISESYIGKMTILSSVGGPVFHEQENVTMKVKLKDTWDCDLEMIAVKFAPTMPMFLDVTVPGISTVAVSTGYTLSGDNIIPTAMDSPFPQFTMKEIEGTVTPQTLTFSLICGIFPLSFSGTKVE